MNVISSLFNFIGNKIGNVSMGTTATTLTGAIAEHESDINGIKDNPSLKWKTVSEEVTIVPGGSLITLSTQFPTLSGYGRQIFNVRCASNNIFCTGYKYDTDGVTPQLRMHSLASSTVTIYVNLVYLYLSNDCTWN